MSCDDKDVRRIKRFRCVSFNPINPRLVSAHHTHTHTIARYKDHRRHQIRSSPSSPSSPSSNVTVRPSRSERTPAARACSRRPCLCLRAPHCTSARHCSGPSSRARRARRASPYPGGAQGSLRSEQRDKTQRDKERALFSSRIVIIITIAIAIASSRPVLAPVCHRPPPRLVSPLASSPTPRPSGGRTDQNRRRCEGGLPGGMLDRPRPLRRRPLPHRPVCRDLRATKT